MKSTMQKKDAQSLIDDMKVVAERGHRKIRAKLPYVKIVKIYTVTEIVS